MKNKINMTINIIPVFVWMLWLCLSWMMVAEIHTLLESLLLIAFPLFYSLYNVFSSDNKQDFAAYNMIFCVSHLVGHYIAGALCYTFISDLADIPALNMFSVISVFYILIITLIFYGIRAIADRFKHKVIAILSIIVIFIILCTCIAFWINPSLNKFKLKSIERNALEYINETYPEFVVEDISVTHEWKMNQYVVDYSDGKGDNRTLIFDHTGDDVEIDEYIHNKSFRIVYDYGENIESQVMQALKNKLTIDIYYVYVEVGNLIGRERDIALNGWDISKEPIVCSMQINSGDEGSTLEFAKSAKEIYAIISSLELPIEKIEIYQQNSPGSRFDITCPANMNELSIEQIEKLVKK